MPAERNKASVATAKFIPIFLASLVAYASYVVIATLAIDYLLNPPSSRIPRRVTAGLAIPIVYCLILIPVGATWLRLLLVVWRDPGYVPLGEPVEQNENEPAPGLENFYTRDVFTCDSRGYPIWCQHCQNWKPDRAHHNRDVGRCTDKMDHFCPWVGGVVGGRSYNFFVQFLLYSFTLSSFLVACLAYFVAERARKGIGQNVQWLVTLGLAAFFCFFTFGMVMNSIWRVVQNLTTIENINPETRTTLLAVLLPPELQGQDLNEPPLPPKPAYLPGASLSRFGDDDVPLASDIDDPSHSGYFSNLNRPRPSRRSSVACQIWKGTITYPLHLPVDRPPLPAPQPRTFAILETLPGMNVWDLGSPWLNFQSVFGRKPHEWLLPIKHSPCCDDSSTISQYPLGPDFEELLVETGLVPRPEHFKPQRRKTQIGGDSRSIASRKRRRKRRLDAGWQNGERPDGWISEKEARRKRNEWRRQNSTNGEGHDRDRPPGPSQPAAS